MPQVALEFCALGEFVADGRCAMSEEDDEAEAFLCLKNIRTFLQTCKNVFNLNNTDLFEPHMLFEYGDFKKVLHTLSVLSRSPKAEASGVRFHIFCS
ncbi:hypothetical protein HPB47_023586 [Ixodes persulcatus]|uniref:Uncharacterized protein n=1 Tax=Ixodes persulcatus TaxID=34615 RepID=A0AC60Q6K2_IXOPE|nr:hypothetical protein HPB47_023586 [Ixodes persulcatus]